MTEPITLDADIARELPGEVGYTIDGWTVVADDRVNERRWTSVHRLVIRPENGTQHYAAEYERGLSESQDTSPWEYNKTVTFKPVVARTRMVEVTEWVSEATHG
jgi:hypothetical protein